MSTMRRRLGWVLVLGLLVAGAAACGDDGGDGGNGSTTTEADAGDTTDGEGAGTAEEDDTGSTDGDDTDSTEGGGSDDPEGDGAGATEGDDTGTTEGAAPDNDALIQEYCDAVEVSNDALDAAQADLEDQAAQDALSQAGSRVSAALSAAKAAEETFTSEQQDQFDECVGAFR